MLLCRVFLSMDVGVSLFETTCKLPDSYFCFGRSNCRRYFIERYSERIQKIHKKHLFWSLFCNNVACLQKFLDTTNAWFDQLSLKTIAMLWRANVYPESSLNNPYWTPNDIFQVSAGYCKAISILYLWVLHLQSSIPSPYCVTVTSKILNIANTA